ncbi:uncharacterized protein LOC129745424 [Uranotaenia lowii]|uniref:uncharacterized protein LOC129745424 n=1 Tax=Uranotaenia lowii TaxID=190385 RepID=UPI002478AD9E|nr:uncharacterized protein LOC129745424 [Uranotaenia lowii]XP_055594471.1 uncharacterized protein LOC129745424 [Uranotaenia lowii]XP_055594472.1 uncharacterized protein LOC129745424 [Uranotaenia lowii]
MEDSQQLQLSLIRRHNHSGGSSSMNLKNSSGSCDGSSGHLVDSGYNSYSFNASSSVVTRSVLATIDEDNEADCSFEAENALRTRETPLKINSILTPTTAASIEQMSNFHLTTPDSNYKENIFVKRRELARKPTCQNLFNQITPEKSGARLFSTTETPVCSGRKSALGSITPRKNKLTAKRKLSSFREKLYSDGDADLLRSSPDSIDEDCKQLEHEEISPIFHAKRRRNSEIDDLIRSSTPKTAGFKSNFHLESQENVNWGANRQNKMTGPRNKPLTLRKFQSFSPRKMHSYRKPESVLQEKSVMVNRKAPLHRQNSFLQSSPRSKLSTPSKRIIETSLEQSFEPPEHELTPAKQNNFTALLEAPILPSGYSKDLEQEVSQLPSLDDCSFTPNKAQSPDQSTSYHPDSVLRDYQNTSISASIVSITEPLSPFPISIAPPKTPSSLSKTTPRRLKRLSRGSSAKKASSPKQKIPITPPTTFRRSYVGTERLNILKRLNENDKDALELILDYLTDSDLVRVVAVSREWQAIIESHRRSFRRLREHLDREAQIKENLDRTGSSNASVTKEQLLLQPLVMVPPGGAKNIRQPFGTCNSIDRSASCFNSSSNTTGGSGLYGNVPGSVQKSPPVSPSRRKFRDNQKIASHLKKSERLKPCPRCEKPSRIVLSKSTLRLALTTGKLTSAALAKLEKSYTLPDPIVGGTDSCNTTKQGDLVSETVALENSQLSPNESIRIRRNLFSTSLLARSCTVDGQTPRDTRRRSSRILQETPLTSANSLLDKKNLRNRRQSTSEIMCTGKSTVTNDESQSDYAMCSGKSCGFVFCIKCLCEYHPDAVCKDLAPNSPSKEEEPVHNVACSKQSRRSLHRLRK